MTEHKESNECLDKCIIYKQLPGNDYFSVRFILECEDSSKCTIGENIIKVRVFGSNRFTDALNNQISVIDEAKLYTLKFNVE